MTDPNQDPADYHKKTGERRREFAAGDMTDQILIRVAARLDEISGQMGTLNLCLCEISASLAAIRDILPAVLEMKGNPDVQPKQ